MRRRLASRNPHPAAPPVSQPSTDAGRLRLVVPEDDARPELAPKFIHLSFVDEPESVEGAVHDEPASTQ